MEKPTYKSPTTIEQELPEGDDPIARTRWFRRSRIDSKGRSVRGAYARAIRQRIHAHPKPFDKPVPSPGVNWTPIGPSVIGFGPGTGSFTEVGRVSAIVAGPNGQRVYAGAADGGVWFSGNAGVTWVPLNDYFSASDSIPGGTPSDINSLSIGAIEVRFGASAATDEIFVGTGEANAGWPSEYTGSFGPESPVDNFFGVGINHYAGGSWTLEATNLESQAIYRIAIDPNDATPTHVYAATTNGLYQRPTGGADPTTWNLVTVNAATPNQPCTDIIAAGSGAGRVFYAALNGDNVYSSTDGASWTPLSGLGSIPLYTGRIALAASESSPNIVYAIVATAHLYRLDSSMGTTFQEVPGLPPGVPYGTYGITVAVDPSDPTTVFLGGSAPLYKGTVTMMGGVPAFTGGGPTYVGDGIHADTHAITYAWNSGGTAHDPTNIWVGCDGGVYQSSSSGASGTFQSLNLGLAISQCYSFGQRSDSDAVVVTGLQDNGGLQMLSQQAAWMSNGIVGDGGSCVWHPTDPYRAMMQFKRTGLTGTTDGGATWTQNTTFPVPPPYSSNQNTENSGTGFVAPLAAIADGGAPGGALFAFGTDRLWMSDDWGVTWVTLPTNSNPYEPDPAHPNLTQDVIAPPSSTEYESVNAIAFASTSRIFAATATVIWRYDLSGGSWSNTVLDTSSFPSGYYITGLAVEDAAAGSIYVTLGGGTGPNVWYFDGASWYAALPVTVVDVPAHAVVVDPSTMAVYAGTDVGCWKGVKSGSGASTSWTWTGFSNGLPQCAILQLSIHQNAYLLRAATCGRGIWEVQLDPAAVGVDPDIYMRVNYADTGRLSGGSRYPWVEGAADPINVGDVVYHWMSADIKVRRSSLPSLPPIGSPPTYLDFAFNVGDYVQPSTDIETADVSGTDTIYVEVHNRSVNTAVSGSNVRVLLLVADASAALPALPSGWATRVNSGDTSAWLGASGWNFVDAGDPYRFLPGDLDVRTPQVVTYQFDFSTLHLPTGHDHVCLAAFVTTVDMSDRITSSNTDLNTVTMTDKHVVHRNLHLVALGAEPLIRYSGLMALTFNNPWEREAVFDIAFQRAKFPARIGLLLPKLSDLSPSGPGLNGFKVHARLALPEGLKEIAGGWMEELGEYVERLGREIEGKERNERHARRHRLFEQVDRHHVLLADAGPHAATVTGVHIPPNRAVTALFSVSPPPGAKPKDRYRLDVIQRHGSRILGGSSYVIAMV